MSLSFIHRFMNGKKFAFKDVDKESQQVMSRAI